MKKKKIREKQAADTGKRELQKFQEGDAVLYRNKYKEWLPATVTQCLPEPRSTLIRTPEGVKYRRNSWFLKHRQTDETTTGNKQPEQEAANQESPEESTILETVNNFKKQRLSTSQLEVEDAFFLPADWIFKKEKREMSPTSQPTTQRTSWRTTPNTYM